MAPQYEDIEDGVARTQYHGIDGWFFTHEAWRNVLIKIRLERKDLELALAAETTDKQIAENDAAALRKHAASLAFAARWGFPLGIGLGTLGTALVVGIVVAILRSLPVQLIQAGMR